MLSTLRAALPGRGETMPSDVLERELTVDPVALAKYAHVCGFTLRDELPPTYPHVLAFGMHMDLLGKAPFSAVGVVHIANRIVQHRPLLLGEELALTRLGERAAAAPARAPVRLRLRGPGRWRARLGGRLDTLKRGDGDASIAREPEFELPPVTARWRLEDDLGRRYAAVSGDHNPIHLHAWAAKAFGFPRAIAHGMWTKARCLSALRLPDAFTADVRFKKPILLPSTVTFGEAEDRFAVHDHLEGTLSA